MVSTPPSVAGLRYLRRGALKVAWIGTSRYRSIVGDARALARQRIFSTPPPSNVGRCATSGNQSLTHKRTFLGLKTFSTRMWGRRQWRYLYVGEDTA